MTINPEQINVNVLLESTLKQTFGFVQLPLYRDHEPDIRNAENFLWFSGFLTYLAESDNLLGVIVRPGASKTARCRVVSGTIWRPT